MSNFLDSYSKNLWSQFFDHCYRRVNTAVSYKNFGQTFEPETNLEPNFSQILKVFTVSLELLWYLSVFYLKPVSCCFVLSFISDNQCKLSAQQRAFSSSVVFKCTTVSIFNVECLKCVESFTLRCFGLSVLL